MKSALSLFRYPALTIPTSIVVVSTVVLYILNAINGPLYNSVMFTEHAPCGAYEGDWYTIKLLPSIFFYTLFAWVLFCLALSTFFALAGSVITIRAAIEATFHRKEAMARWTRGAKTLVRGGLGLIASFILGVGIAGLLPLNHAHVVAGLGPPPGYDSLGFSTPPGCGFSHQ